MVRKAFVALGLCLVMAFGAALVSCGPQVNTDEFIGEWELIYGSEEALDQESIALAKSLGSSVLLTLQDDGSGTLDMYGEVSNLTWTASSDTEGTLKIDGMGDASIELDGETLILSDSDGESLTFARP